MNTLVVDIGGTNVKVWKTGESDKVKFESGQDFTPQALVDQVKEVATDWKFDRVSIGYPGRVQNGHPTTEPVNLATGWIDFDYAQAFACPVRMMNDACLQALGSYEGGRMLYLGLGTSIGTAVIADGKLMALALGHLQFQDATFNDYLCREGLKERGEKKWGESVAKAAATLKAAFFADYIVLGGGNTKKLSELPEGCRRGGNHNAYFGGLRLWEDSFWPAERHPVKAH